MTTIGFIGIGNMGWPMATNLVGAAFDVTVCDAVAGRADSFAAEIGGRAATGAADVATGAEVLITMLPTSAHVADALGEVGDALAPGAIVIEMSSGLPLATRALAAELAERGVALVDCPVSGGVRRAKTAELSIMVGGDEADLARVRPVLDALGGSIHHCGEVGAGQAMKALNNLVSAGGFLIAMEALLIGKEFGLDPARMIEVLNASSGMNNSTDKKFAQYVLSRSFDSGFGIDLMAKDLAVAMDIADDGGITAPFAALCAQLWAAGSKLLGPGHDHTEMARFSERISGREVT